MREIKNILQSEIILSFFCQALIRGIGLEARRNYLDLLKNMDTCELAAACIKAKEYGIWDVRRIERMLKNNVEENTALSNFPTLFTDSPRFTRDGSYFKNYN